MSSKEAEACWLEQQEISTKSLDRMRNTGVLTDVVVICSGKEFHAHRSHLCSASLYFEAMFQAGMSEAVTGKIEVKDISATSVEDVIKFLYTGVIPDVRNDVERIRELLHATHLMQITTLFNFLLKCFGEMLSANFFLQLWEVSEMYEIVELSTKVFSFITSNFRSVVADDEFCKMSVVQLKQLLQHPKLGETPSHVIVDGVISWTKVNVEERQGELESLLSLVNLKRLSRSYMTTLIDEPVVVNNQSVFNVFARQAITNMNQHLPYLFCFGTNASGNVLTIFDVEREEWLPPKQVNISLVMGMAMVELAGSIYFIGGNEGKKSNTQGTAVYKYSPAGNTVEVVGNLLKPVHQAGANVLRDLIYVVGGLDANGATCWVQRFDPSNGACEELCPTNSVHNRPFVLCFVDRVYVVGAARDNDSNVEYYDLREDYWTTLTIVPPPVFWCNATVCNNKLVVVRKENDGQFFWYDFFSDEWKRNKFSSSPSTSASSVDGIWSVDVVGGRKEQVILVKSRDGKLYKYDPKINVWKQLAERNEEPWHSSHTAVVYTNYSALFGVEQCTCV